MTSKRRGVGSSPIACRPLSASHRTAAPQPASWLTASWLAPLATAPAIHSTAPAYRGAACFAGAALLAIGAAFVAVQVAARHDGDSRSRFTVDRDGQLFRQARQLRLSAMAGAAPNAHVQRGRVRQWQNDERLAARPPLQRLVRPPAGYHYSSHLPLLQ